MLLDLTANNKGGHFDYFSKWSKSLESNIIDSKKLLLQNFFKILETDRLIIPSANIFDRHFLVYFIIVTLRYFLGKNQNFFIIHSIRRLKLFSFISPRKSAKYFSFSSGITDEISKYGFDSNKVLFPNVKEFDIESEILNLQFDEYLVIWGRSAREINSAQIDFLSKSQFNFIIINSKLKNEGHDNIAFINTQDIKEQKFILQNSLACVIILSENSQEYFKKSYAASGILITNVYLNIFSYVVGNIPSHENEYNDFCLFLPESVTIQEIDQKILETNIPKRFNTKFNLIEEFL